MLVTLVQEVCVVNKVFRVHKENLEILALKVQEVFRVTKE
jgi:hypothetical protein